MMVMMMLLVMIIALLWLLIVTQSLPTTQKGLWHVKALDRRTSSSEHRKASEIDEDKVMARRLMQQMSESLSKKTHGASSSILPEEQLPCGT
jgi:biopolymer transport protein ExbB/TolQ